MIITKKISVFAVVGFSITIFGGILSFFWDSIFNFMLNKEFRLTPTSKLFELWRDLPIPIELTVYFFNWTNPEEILNEGFKPKLVEIGPYVFKEKFQKVNFTWNTNATLTYRNLRHWYFDPEKSVGSLDDNITTLNPVPLSAAYVSRNYAYFYKIAISSAIRISRQNIWISRSVGEFLFTGYPDPLMTVANSMPFLQNENVGNLGNRFSWFHGRNGTSIFEGVFNIETGEDDASKTGIIREWNYRNRTDFFDGECGMISGSDGMLFHAGLRRDEPIEMFHADFCKSIKLEYLEDKVTNGVNGYRYVGTKMLLDKGELDPKNSCNCKGECLPFGILNLSSCHFGAPGFASYPHFLDADPYYLELVEGLQPNESRHRMYTILEPTTGIPIEAYGRIQLNLLLQPYESIGLYNDVPEIVFPMLWLEQSARLTPEYFLKLKILLAIPEKGIYFSIGLMVIGIIIITITFFTTCKTKDPRRNNVLGQKSYLVLQVMQPEKNKTTHEEHILLERRE